MSILMIRKRRVIVSFCSLLLLISWCVFYEDNVVIAAPEKLTHNMPCLDFIAPFTRKMSSAKLTNLVIQETKSAPPMCSRFKYAVYAPPYRDTSGGIMVLYNLASRLQALGCSVSMTGPAKENPWRVPVRPKSVVAGDENTIVIYPETVTGNPFNQTRSAHWLLYYPGIHGGAFDYSEHDVILAYASWDIADGENAPGTPHPIKSPYQILVQASDWGLNLPDAFSSIPRPMFPHRSYFLVRKGAIIWPKVALARNISQIKQIATEIPTMSPSSFCKLMRTAKYFFTFDPHTYYSVLASLCGAISVVLLPPNLRPEDIKRVLPWTRQGIAFGMHEVDWARKSAGSLRRFMECVELYTQASLRYFVNVTQDWDDHFPTLNKGFFHILSKKKL